MEIVIATIVTAVTATLLGAILILMAMHASGSQITIARFRTIKRRYLCYIIGSALLALVETAFLNRSVREIVSHAVLIGMFGIIISNYLPPKSKEVRSRQRVGR